MLIRSENLQITLSLESFSQNNNEIQSKILSQMFAIQFVSIEKILQTQKVQDKNEVIKKIVQTSKRNNFSIFQLCEHLPPKYLTVYQ